jgi:uncharacterized protein YkwD
MLRTSASNMKVSIILAICLVGLVAFVALGGSFTLPQVKLPELQSSEEVEHETVDFKKTETPETLKIEKPKIQPTTELKQDKVTISQPKPTQNTITTKTITKQSSPSDMERTIFLLINKVRQENGVRPLVYDENVAKVARGHSLDMAQNGFYSHFNKKGEDPLDRYMKTGFTSCSAIYTVGYAENIAALFLDDKPEVAVELWMDSAGHRRNILENSFTRTGIGVAADSDEYFITQNFC